MIFFPVNRISWYRLLVIVFWLVLVAVLVKRELFITTVSTSERDVIEQARREEYQGIYFRENKIGYVINRYNPEKGEMVRIDQQAHMNLHVGDQHHLIDLHLNALLHDNGALENFHFQFSSPFYRMEAEGAVRDKFVEFTLTTGSNVISDRLPVSRPPFVPTARRGYLLRQGLEPGDKLKIPWFDPVSLTAKDSVVEYRGRERIRVGGRVHNLHHFTENYGGARVSLWLSDDGDVIKEESPAGFVFLKEPKFRALELAGTSDELLAAVAVEVTGEMPDTTDLSEMHYRLEVPKNAVLDLDGGRQRYDGGILTIVREQLPTQATDAVCGGQGDNLAASPYIQADAEPIRQVAEEVAGPADEPLARVRRLADWVYRHLEKRPVLGIPDALTTLENRRGDCNEHAALFTALARNRGIPTRIAAGVVFHQGAFYYHAWNEVCVGGQWLSVDTTTNQLPADLSHIKFVEGELDQQVRIGALLGKLAIEPLPAKE